MPAEQNVVTLSRHGNHVALVTLVRPDARNAVNAAVAHALEAAVTTTEDDPAIRAVVLTGAGDIAFCAGADLKAVAAGEANSLWTERGGFAGFVFAPRRKPWIAAVNGVALAGGLEIALACDMIVASNAAEFGLPEVARGLIAGAGGLYRLPHALPRAIALELIATASRLTADRAYALGLVNAVVEPGRVRDAALDLALRIATNAPVAVQESLGVARQAAYLNERECREQTATARDAVMRTQDYREGPRAFVEKRAPKWIGA